MTRYVANNDTGAGIRRALDRSKMRHDKVRILQRYQILRPKWARPRYREIGILCLRGHTYELISTSCEFMCSSFITELKAVKQ